MLKIFQGYTSDATLPLLYLTVCFRRMQSSFPILDSTCSCKVVVCGDVCANFPRLECRMRDCSTICMHSRRSITYNIDWSGEICSSSISLSRTGSTRCCTTTDYQLLHLIDKEIEIWCCFVLQHVDVILMFHVQPCSSTYRYTHLPSHARFTWQSPVSTFPPKTLDGFLLSLLTRLWWC
jgi:hypothetical protein